jgi:hypothetical protein
LNHTPLADEDFWTNVTLVDLARHIASVFVEDFKVIKPLVKRAINESHHCMQRMQNGATGNISKQSCHVYAGKGRMLAYKKRLLLPAYVVLGVFGKDASCGVGNNSAQGTGLW